MVFSPSIPLLALLLASAGTSFSASAGVEVSGPYLDETENPSGSCALQFGRGLHLCSASLISPRHVLTSAHCLSTIPRTLNNKLRDFSVACGNGRYRQAWKRHFLPSGSSERLNEGKPISYAEDYMVVELWYPFEENAAKPFKMVSSLPEIERLVRLGQCRFSGSGQGNDGYTGTVRTVHMPRVDVNPFRASKVDHLVSGYDPLHTARGGDSGGPLYCLDEANEPVLIGIHRGSLTGKKKSGAVSGSLKGADFALALGSWDLMYWIQRAIEGKLSGQISPLKK